MSIKDLSFFSYWLLSISTLLSFLTIKVVIKYTYKVIKYTLIRSIKQRLTFNKEDLIFLQKGDKNFKVEEVNGFHKKKKKKKMVN